MNEESLRRTFGLRNLIALAVLFCIGCTVLFPVISSWREASRRTQCLDHMRALATGFRDYESATGRLPSSSRVTRDAQGRITSIDGWSWCVDLLSSLDQAELWQTLDIEGGVPLRPNDDGTSSHADALATSIPELRCPSFGDRPFVGGANREAITNYKAMGATHMESLNVASPAPTVPKYAHGWNRHPDGAIYPGSTHGYRAFKGDGISSTILLVETVEKNVARWTVGNECALVGLPPVVEFADDIAMPYWHPKGHTRGNYWDMSTVDPEMDKTYLNWDYDANPYSDGGVSTPSANADGPMKYGPSSHHPDVTNHLFADGSACSINNRIDVSMYMFRITRNNGDPCLLFPIDEKSPRGWPR